MSPVTLKWKGDVLYLGATKMAEVKPVHDVLGDPPTAFSYVIGLCDHVSELFQSKVDAKQDAERHVRDLLAKTAAL